MRLVIALVLALMLGACTPSKSLEKQRYSWGLITVIREDGCTQEWDCDCGVCPPYGEVHAVEKGKQ